MINYFNILFEIDGRKGNRNPSVGDPGTAKGRNWFYDLFTRELDDFERVMRFPSSRAMSSFFTDSEWEDARRTLPEDVFRQEYMAEFLEDCAGVFQGLMGVWTGRALPRR